MITFEITDGYAYRIEGNLKSLFGQSSFSETIRIDDNTVADVSYEFNVEQGQYVEQSRVERSESLPPEPLTPEQEIAQLKQQISVMQSAIDDLIMGGGA